MLNVPLCPPLEPRAESALRVVLVCWTPTVNPDLLCRAIQESGLRHWLSRHFDGPIAVRVVAGDSSGRADVRQILEIVQRGDVDLVLAEDLSRISRRPKKVVLLCDTCQLHQTRVIALESGFDTACPRSLIDRRVLLQP